MQQSWSTRKAFFGSNSVPSGRIKDWSVMSSVSSSEAIILIFVWLSASFKMAYEDPEPLSELIFHSGYGSQYLSHRFQQFLREHHTKQPFSHLGKPYDNTVAETFFASLKKKSSTERTFLPIERLKPVLLHISSFIIPIVH